MSYALFNGRVRVPTMRIPLFPRFLDVRPASVLTVVLLSALGCSGKEPAPAAATVSDSSGILTVHLGAVADSTIPSWSSEPLFDTSKDPGAFLLDAGWVGARFGTDSGLLIANVDELRYLAPGAPLATFLAGRGEGPDDFRSISFLGVSEDGNPFVVESMGERLSTIEWGGARTGIAVPPVDMRGNRMLPVAVLRGLRFLAVPFQWQPNSGGAGGYLVGTQLRDSVPLVAYDWSGVVAADTLGLWPGLERASGLAVPFARATLYAGRGAATVLGITDSIDLRLFMGRDMQLRLIGPYRRREPTVADRAAWDRLVAEEIDPALPPFLAALPDFTPQLPEIGGFAVDDAANIWVGDYAVPGQALRRWRAFSRNGELLGALELPVVQGTYFPSRTELLDVVGDRIAVLREAPDGALFIEVRRVRR